jgi:hypothetical protein
MTPSTIPDAGITLGAKIARTVMLVAAVSSIALAVRYFSPVAVDAQAKIPLRYRIGHIDPRYKIAPERLLALAQEAAQVWGSPLHATLLIYDSTAPLRINLVFDDRQARWLEATRLREALAAGDEAADRLGSDYETRVRTQAEMERKLDRHRTDWDRRLQAYNDRVNSWNTKGGAPPEVFAGLERERAALDAERPELEAEADALNAYARETNGLVGTHNAIVDRGNEAIRSYNERHDTNATFHKGAFDPARSTIDIFQVEDDADLRFTLAHELGHALGFPDTNGDPNSIMHHTIGDQDKNHLVLSPEDLRLVLERYPKK